MIQPLFHYLQAAIQTFENSSVTSTVKGFHITNFPLYKLGCLLDENWLDEDVFNGMVELFYFSQWPIAIYNIILPMCFLADASQVYETPDTEYTPKIAAFRRHIAKTLVKTVAFGSVGDNYFTVYVYHMESPNIYYGDSLHHSPTPTMLSIL